MPVSLSAPYPVRRINIHKHTTHAPHISHIPSTLYQVLFAPLPVLWITGSLATASKADKNMYYDAPLYKAPRRTGLNFISSVQLRTEEQPQKWTLRGVALLATID